MILLRPTNVKYTLSPFKEHVKQTPPPQPGRALIDNAISMKTAWLIVVNGLRILLYINKSWLTDLHEVHSFSLYRARWSWYENFQSFNSQTVENSEGS